MPRHFSRPTWMDQSDPRIVTAPPIIGPTLPPFEQASALARWIVTLPQVHDSRAWRRREPPHEVRTYIGFVPGFVWNRPTAADMAGGILYVEFSPRRCLVYRRPEWEEETFATSLAAIREWAAANFG
jgi:hypothetical protein